jgi:excisionase family DNA binding protein
MWFPVSADDFLTVPEVAERLRVTTMTIYRWIEDGKLPAMQIGKQYRIRSGDVDELLESSRVGAGRGDPWGGDVPSGPSVQ